MAKTDTRDPSRRIMFEEAGQGVYLLLRNSGLRALQGYYDREHIEVVERAFLTMDIPVYDRLLEIMAWKGEDHLVVKFNDLDDVSVETVTNKLRDAWCLSLNGRKYMEQVEFIREEARKLTQDPHLTSPAAGSEPSEEPPTKQA